MMSIEVLNIAKRRVQSTFTSCVILKWVNNRPTLYKDRLATANKSGEVIKIHTHTFKVTTIIHI